MDIMVGKPQDVVSAAVVIGATEKATSSPAKEQPSSSAFDTPAATVENSQTQTHFIVGNQGTASENNQNQQEDAADDIQINPGSINQKSLDNITQELNKLMRSINANIQFDYHEEVGVMSIRMIDRETGEIIKELPPDDVITDMVKTKIWLGAVIGTFVDKSA